MTITADTLRTRVTGLPEWQGDEKDEDWIIPLQEFEGLIAYIDPYADTWNHWRSLEATETMVTITPDTPVYTGQDSLRLDTLVHYLDHRDELWDPDGWFGTDHPVVVPWENGYRVFDGNHRTTADRITGRPTLAYLAKIKD